VSAPPDFERFIHAAVSRHGSKPDAVIPILQSVQDHYGYLPEHALKLVCDTTEITPASLAGVASFYDMFRHQPVGKHIIRVCRGTACHVTGAERVEEALRRQLNIPNGDDTDPTREYTIEQVACLGCCTLAPVVKIDGSTFGHVAAEQVESTLREFAHHQKRGPRPSTEDLHPLSQGGPQINIGLGSCCMAKGSDLLYQALRESVEKLDANVAVKRVGCVGMCHRTPMIEVVQPGKPSAFYAGLDAAEAPYLVRRHFRGRSLAQRASRWWARVVDTLLVEEDDVERKVTESEMKIAEPAVSAFLQRQVHIATEEFGKVDPLDLEEYVANGGFSALAQCLPRPENGTGTEFWKTGGNGSPDGAQHTALAPEKIIDLIERSGLRGRGGAGFPSAAKWKLARKQTSETKYLICNGDEGDPGAFMDRMLLESFPYRIIEGMAIAAVAIGAHDCIFYIRHEYPLAVKRVRAAIKLCQKRGWIGDKLLGTDYPLRFTIKEGAGAFVCGEETALIASIEGQRGMPRLRPPFPAQEGLHGKPTVINNVETLAMIPWILRHGPEAFARYGTPASKGTKVFALAGNVQRGGLIEIPMGTTIREIVEEIGGGVAPGRRFKAVQIGGPSGGCVPARLADTSVDFESLREVGAIMGSGGLVVLDDSACMVDIARYFLEFTQKQSCGKCTFCRIGTRRLLDILERLCAGKGQKNDLAELERLCAQVGAGSLCGLGKTAPNPVLTTLRYFRSEYEAHLQGRCPAGKCVALIKYTVNENCTGCTKCAQVCPVDAIPLTPYARHHIDLDKCTRCDSCRRVCPHQAIDVG
jgi:NADH:ubiquinone oxidoreductase subunit F (NADH-binding)/NADH:ubiquinone oxidoreductase subunit E/NAD-dependent dihydropyrimidine dehydrogenase PreA subunit